MVDAARRRLDHRCRARARGHHRRAPRAPRRSGRLVPLRINAMRFACPCCGYLTLLEKPPGTYAICEVCFWEDDPVQFADQAYEGGANVVSLAKARENYRTMKVCDPRFASEVRAPRPDEVPP